MNAKTECLKMHLRLDVSLEKLNFFFSVGRPTVFGGLNFFSVSEKKKVGFLSFGWFFFVVKRKE